MSKHRHLDKGAFIAEFTAKLERFYSDFSVTPRALAAALPVNRDYLGPEKLFERVAALEYAFRFERTFETARCLRLPLVGLVRLQAMGQWLSEQVRGPAAPTGGYLLKPKVSVTLGELAISQYLGEEVDGTEIADTYWDVAWRGLGSPLPKPQTRRFQTALLVAAYRAERLIHAGCIEVAREMVQTLEQLITDATALRDAEIQRRLPLAREKCGYAYRHLGQPGLARRYAYDSYRQMTHLGLPGWARVDALRTYARSTALAALHTSDLNIRRQNVEEALSCVEEVEQIVPGEPPDLLTAEAVLGAQLAGVDIRVVFNWPESGRDAWDALFKKPWAAALAKRTDCPRTVSKVAFTEMVLSLDRPDLTDFARAAEIGRDDPRHDCYPGRGRRCDEMVAGAIANNRDLIADRVFGTDSVSSKAQPTVKKAA